MVNDKVFKDLYAAQTYKYMFTHHTIVPLYLG